MAHVIIDRRLNSKGKSLGNRQKFLERVRGALRQGARDTIGNIDITDIGQGEKKIKVPGRGLDEPWFVHGDEGINHRIVTGNKQYIVGDVIPRPTGGEGQGGGEGSEDGEGEDEFVFTLTKDEFVDLYLDNCELPHMVRKMLSTSCEQELRRQGFRTDGSPATLNIVRSMRTAKSRKFGFTAGKKRKLKQLEAELAVLTDKFEAIKLLEAQVDATTQDLQNGADIQARMKELVVEIEELTKKIKNIPFLDPMDLRYNAWSMVDVPAIQAVMFCILDVSGSMDEDKKRIAKTFFMLLYLFLERSYDHVDIVFIRHHTEAAEVTEEEFFRSKESGGTVVSPALQLMLNIIDRKYDVGTWNIFVAQGSDGDNWGSDNMLVNNMLHEKILPIVQYYAYAQINPGNDHRASSDPWNMWSMFNEIATTHENLGAGMITDDDNVYNVFKKLFEKRASVE